VAAFGSAAIQRSVKPANSASAAWLAVSPTVLPVPGVTPVAGVAPAQGRAKASSRLQASKEVRGAIDMWAHRR
jgi:hypothetical protein